MLFRSEPGSRDELQELLTHALAQAGNASLMTTELIDALVDQSAGNPRVLMSLSADLLAHGLVQQVPRLDEKLYLEVFQATRPRPASKKKASV